MTFSTYVSKVKNIAGNPEKAAPHIAVLHIQDGRPTDRQTYLPTDIVTY